MAQHQFWLEGIRVVSIDPKAPPPEPIWRLPVIAVSEDVAKELAEALTPILARGDGSATEIRVSQKIRPIERFTEESQR